MPARLPRLGCERQTRSSRRVDSVALVSTLGTAWLLWLTLLWLTTATPCPTTSTQPPFSPPPVAQLLATATTTALPGQTLLTSGSASLNLTVSSSGSVAYPTVVVNGQVVWQSPNSYSPTPSVSLVWDGPGGSLVVKYGPTPSPSTSYLSYTVSGSTLNLAGDGHLYTLTSSGAKSWTTDITVPVSAVPSSGPTMTALPGDVFLEALSVENVVVKFVGSHTFTPHTCSLSATLIN